MSVGSLQGRVIACPPTCECQCVTSGFPLECFVVSTERGEANEAMEEVVGPGGNGITVHSGGKLEWHNHISDRQDFESVEEVVH